jgi:hypothetical protein
LKVLIGFLTRILGISTPIRGVFEKIWCFSHEKGLKNTEKAGLPIGKPRSAVTKIRYFPAESKKC